MKFSHFHPNRQAEKIKENTNGNIRSLFDSVPKNSRLAIGQAYRIKQPSATLSAQTAQDLRANNLLEGYCYAIEESKHLSITADLNATKQFIELCAVEADQNVAPLWKRHELISLSDPNSVTNFLDQVEEDARTAQIEQISSQLEHHFGEEIPRAKGLIAKGRKLLENGRELEFCVEKFDRIMAKPQGSGWSQLSLLAKHRPMALVPLMGRIHDPCARVFLSAILSQNSYSFQLGIQLIQSKVPAAVTDGLKQCLNILGRIVHTYATRDLSKLHHQTQILERRQKSLFAAYERVWREITNSCLLKTGNDLVLIKRGFSIQPGTWAANGRPDLGECGYNAFVAVGSEWIRANPTETKTFAECFVPPQREVEFVVHLLGDCLQAQVLDMSLGSPSKNLINTITQFFFEDLKSEETVYKRQLMDRRRINEVNAWVRFFSGARVVLGKAWLLNLFNSELNFLRNRLTNRWRPSDKKYGTEDSLTYGCLVFLYAKIEGPSSDVSATHQMLSMLEGVFPSDVGARGNWEALLSILYRNITDPTVKAFIESGWFSEGVSPDFYAVMQETMLTGNPALQARARELVLDYRDFYIEQIEQFREQLTARGLL